MRDPFIEQILWTMVYIDAMLILVNTLLRWDND